MRYSVEFNANGKIVKENGEKKIAKILDRINKMVLVEEKK